MEVLKNATSCVHRPYTIQSIRSQKYLQSIRSQKYLQNCQIRIEESQIYVTTILYKNFFLKKYQDAQYKKRAIEIFYASKNGLQKQLDFYSKKKVSLWTYRKFLLSDQYQDAHTRQKGAEKHRKFLYFSEKTVSLKIRTRPQSLV